MAKSKPYNPMHVLEDKTPFEAELSKRFTRPSTSTYFNSVPASDANKRLKQSDGSSSNRDTIQKLVNNSNDGPDMNLFIREAKQKAAAKASPAFIDESSNNNYYSNYDNHDD